MAPTQLLGSFDMVEGTYGTFLLAEAAYATYADAGVVSAGTMEPLQ